MDTRLEKIRSLKLDRASEEVPRAGWGGAVWFALGAASATAVFVMMRSGPEPVESGEGVVAVPVAAAPVAPSRLSAAGYVEPIPPFPVHIAPLVLGRIDEFAALEGHPLKAGDVVARLNARELENRREELEAALGVNNAKLRLARKELAREESLAQSGVATARELDQAQASAAILEAEARKLEAELQTLSWQIEQTAVRAPVDGVLFERSANVGDFIHSDSNRKIGSIYDPAHLQVWVDINQRDAGRVRVGQRVEISIDADPSNLLRGTVARIVPRASLSKNTLQAKVVLDEVSEHLRPDMSVRVMFLDEAQTSEKISSSP